MKVSLNWIRKLTEVNLGLNQLIDMVGSQLGAIDEVVDLGAKYRNVYVVRIVAVQQHPNADKLRLCFIDDGNENREVPRNDHGFIQVVCGAPNVRAEMLAVWLPPGVTVPETFDTDDPVVLGVRSMRGTDSYGMLASPKELAMGDSHGGIFEVDEPSRPGELFADSYELNDFIIDIENKMFTHRPDLFGMLGIAREIAGLTRQRFASPAWYTNLSDNPLPQETRPLPLVVDNKVPELVPHFMAVILTGVKPGLSPLLFQSYLIRVGVRPINNIVDVTNYMMLLTGQPLHAYDYDKIKALDSSDTGQVSLNVRHPKDKETVSLLGGKQIQPRPEAILVSTALKPIGLGGIMGGNNAEVDGRTESIVIECASFDMFNVRRTSMEHGIFTDASTRFTKGQSPLQNERVLVKAVEVIKGMAGGLVASTLFDDRHFDGIVASNETVHQPIKVTIDFINARLGSKFTQEAIETLLTNVEFKVQQITIGQVLVTAPFWRTDIIQAEDLVEEIGRLYGFDKLPASLPRHDLTPTNNNEQFELRDKIRHAMAGAGANEVLTYSFVDEKLMQRAGQDPNQAWQLANALSPALQSFRESLIPSLLDKVQPNVKSGHLEFGLFEIGKAHIKGETGDDELPKEQSALAFVFTAAPKITKERYGGAALYQAKVYVDALLERFHMVDKVQLEPVAAGDIEDDPWLQALAAPFDLTRSVAIRNDAGIIQGIVGEFSVDVRKAFKLPEFTAGFELNPDLLSLGDTKAAYRPLSRYPGLEQDITFKVATDMPYKKLAGFVQHHLDKHRPKHTEFNVRPLDIYQSDADKPQKHISLRLRLASSERTLTDKEVSLVMDNVATAAKDELHAERV